MTSSRISAGKPINPTAENTRPSYIPITCRCMRRLFSNDFWAGWRCLHASPVDNTVISVLHPGILQDIVFKNAVENLQGIN
jgi:hypothetical protein